MTDKGFTIVELVLIIILLGIMAVLATPRMISLRQEAREANRDFTVSSIQEGLTLYNVQQVTLYEADVYPAALDSAPNGVCVKSANPTRECFSTVLRFGLADGKWTRYFGGLLYRHNDTNTWYWYRSGIGFFMCIANCWE